MPLTCSSLIQAIGAIENALLDVVGKALGVPCSALFGGPVRTELPVYWSHCGSFRVNYHKHLTSPHRDNKPVPPLRYVEGAPSNFPLGCVDNKTKDKF